MDSILKWVILWSQEKYRSYDKQIASVDEKLKNKYENIQERPQSMNKSRHQIIAAYERRNNLATKFEWHEITTQSDASPKVEWTNAEELQQKHSFRTFNGKIV